MPSKEDIIAWLQLEPHPEGGYFRETFRDRRELEGRSASTAIYYLLGAGDVSHWHRVDATEVWHYYGGSPLELRIAPKEGGALSTAILGLEREYSPQCVVPAGHWQSARSLGEWTLTGCTVAPGFEFSGFELAPRDWSP